MGFGHVQGAGSYSGSLITSTSASLGTAPASGDWVCVSLILINTSGTAPSSVAIKDSNSNNYTISPNSPSTGSSGGYYVWIYLAYLKAPANASSSISASWTTSCYVGFWIDDFSITGGTSSFDKDVAGTLETASSGSATLPSITPSASGELLYSAGVDVTNYYTAPAAGATLGGWTGAALALQNSGDDGSAEYILSSTGSATGTDYTCEGSSDAYLNAIMAFTFTASGFQPDEDFPVPPSQPQSADPTVTVWG